MKKIGFILLILVASAVSVEAQQEVLSYFDTNGTVRLETQELNAAADTLVTVFHRKDDVVWSRMTFRIIDLRYKQNYQLYFPIEPDNPTYKSLFRIIIEAIADTLPIYEKDPRNFVPTFSKERRIPASEIVSRGPYLYAGDIENIGDESYYLLQYDSVNQKIVYNDYVYQSFIRNQFKYVIQEVIFFDKHTSRLHRQIIAIAPMQPDLATSSTKPMEFLKESVRFWVLYKDLRPYLAKQYMIPLQNTTKRVTFDDFFQKRLYTSYLIGETNIYNRMILDYAKTEEAAKKEQARIETELLNFEQDLWEY